MLELIGLGDDIFDEICVAQDYLSVKDSYRKPSKKFWY